MVSLIILFQTRLNVKVRHRSLRPTTDGHVVPRHSGGVIHAQIHEGGERGFSGRFDQTSGLILEEQREKVTTGPTPTPTVTVGSRRQQENSRHKQSPSLEKSEGRDQLGSGRAAPRQVGWCTRYGCAFLESERLKKKNGIRKTAPFSQDEKSQE